VFTKWKRLSADRVFVHYFSEHELVGILTLYCAVVTICTIPDVNVTLILWDKKECQVMELQSCANGVLCTGNYLYHSGFGQESLCMDLAIHVKKVSLRVFGLSYDTFILDSVLRSNFF
jgi:hypothetical protein